MYVYGINSSPRMKKREEPLRLCGGFGRCCASCYPTHARYEVILKLDRVYLCVQQVTELSAIVLLDLLRDDHCLQSHSVPVPGTGKGQLPVPGASSVRLWPILMSDSSKNTH